MTDSPIRIVIPMDVIGDEIPSPVEAYRIADTRAADDFASFAELLSQVEAGRAAAQRADWHVDMPDAALTALAARSVYPRRSLWRRIVTWIGGAR